MGGVLISPCQREGQKNGPGPPFALKKNGRGSKEGILNLRGKRGMTGALRGQKEKKQTGHAF